MAEQARRKMAPLRWLLWLAAALILAPQVAQAQWNKDYFTAKKQYEAGEYAAARERLLTVIAANPTPTPRGNLGGRRSQVYVPQLYLGLSSAALGDCTEALRYLRDPTLTNVVAGLREEEDLRRAAAEKCDRTLAALAPAPAPAPQVAEPRPQPPALSEVPPGPVAAPGTRPSVAPTPPTKTPAEPAPAPVSTATAPKSEADLWTEDAPSIRRLLQDYLKMPVGALTLPPAGSFRSVRGRQWRTLLEALDLAGRGLLVPSGNPERERLLGQARSMYRAAESLGALPPHDNLCAPGMLRIIKAE